jgi:hypothetical protein
VTTALFHAVAVLARQLNCKPPRPPVHVIGVDEVSRSKPQLYLTSASGAGGAGRSRWSAWTCGRLAPTWCGNTRPMRRSRLQASEEGAAQAVLALAAGTIREGDYTAFLAAYAVKTGP